MMMSHDDDDDDDDSRYNTDWCVTLIALMVTLRCILYTLFGVW